MTDFVLVHGAWHGGWCWRRVAEPLARAGHRSHAVTLTGCGDRAHLLTRDITLETHIADVVNTIATEELTDVVLAVHSYAGMIGTAVADRIGDRLAHVVYVDAVLPLPDESWSSTHAPATRDARIAARELSPDRALPPGDPAVFGLTGTDADWVRRRQTPHPGATYDAPLAFDPRRVSRIARTYVSCTRPRLATIDASRQRAADDDLWDGAWAGGAGRYVVELATGHDPMVSAPDALREILLRAAR